MAKKKQQIQIYKAQSINEQNKQKWLYQAAYRHTPAKIGRIKK